MTPFQLADALVDDLAALSPTAATFWGVPGYDHRWDDLSPDGVAHHRTTLQGWRARIGTLAPQTERWSRLAVHVLEDHLDLALDAFAHGDERRDLNHLASSFQHLVRTFDAMDTSTLAGWEAVATRLETLDGALDGYQRTLDQGLDRGEAVAARQVRSVVAQGRVYASDQGSFAALPARLRALALGDGALERRLDAAALRARGAYRTLTDWLEHRYLPAATPVDGVGRDRYARAARRSVGGAVDLDETLAWGWDEVRSIQARMGVVARKLGAEPVGEIVRRLQTEPAFAAPSAEVFLERMAERQRIALEALDGAHFDVPAPLHRLDVKRAPPGGPPGAYYVAPSEDLSRPGAVWYSLTDGPQALWDEVSTAYHEGFPGHHLQVGLQVALREHLCRVHRVAYGYSGYAEGWALYAESLMGDLGYYERPEYELGMLANQLMRACRVVFDIGAHVDQPIPTDAGFHPGERWSFDLGVELMTTVGGMTRPTAESEITRYLGWPGQAISYKVGQRAMLALRDDFLATGGTLRTFHDRVLGCGNVGLALLRAEVLTPA